MVGANGLHAEGYYYDRYAYRGTDYPFGPELIGITFWDEVSSGPKIHFKEEKSWVSVYSAFGGLAIYKRKSLLKASYSGLVTSDLKKYYSYIFKLVSIDNPQFKKYCELNGFRRGFDLGKYAVIFRQNSQWYSADNYFKITCCEHVPFHASMALQGHGKFYINPKLIMKY